MPAFQNDGSQVFEKGMPASESWQETLNRFIYVLRRAMKEFAITSFWSKHSKKREFKALLSGRNLSEVPSNTGGHEGCAGHGTSEYSPIVALTHVISPQNYLSFCPNISTI